MAVVLLAAVLRAAVPLAKAAVWHHWLSLFIAFPVLVLIVAIVVGYLVKVVAPKYGRR
jgi:hypothetical protein